MDVQVRSEETGLRNFSTLQEAFAYAAQDSTVWKISFALANGERVRLIRDGYEWIYESIFEDWASRVG